MILCSEHPLDALSAMSQHKWLRMRDKMRKSLRTMESLNDELHKLQSSGIVDGFTREFSGCNIFPCMQKLNLSP